MKAPGTFTLVVCLSLATTTLAQAQSLEDRLRSQLVSVTAQLRAAQSSQTELTAQKAVAEKERDALKAKLAAAQATKRPASASPDYQRLKAQADELAQANADLQSQLTAARSESRRLGEDFERERSLRDQTAAALTADRSDLSVCKEKNAQLLSVAKELLAAYSGVGMVDVLARKEPMTGLKRTQIERLEQDFGDRIYHGQLDVRPRTPPPATDKSPSN